jgi:hypothetical protein
MSSNFWVADVESNKLKMDFNEIKNTLKNELLYA